ncbi:hypothetical protein ACS0TY_010600 [Phlomoides rotata]
MPKNRPLCERVQRSDPTPNFGFLQVNINERAQFFILTDRDGGVSRWHPTWWASFVIGEQFLG